MYSIEECLVQTDRGDPPQSMPTYRKKKDAAVGKDSLVIVGFLHLISQL